MTYTASSTDRDFASKFEAGEVEPSSFTHRAHVRLAYVYLTEMSANEASKRMKRALLAFLKRNGVAPSKYHETLTFSWVKAVRHFMNRSGGATSFDHFIAANDALLDGQIMLHHYSRDTLFSDKARKGFVEPDLLPIP